MRDNILKDVYAQDKIELSSMDVQLGAIEDLVKRRMEIIQKYNYTDELNKLKLAIDTRMSFFTRLNNDIAPILKQLKDLGITDKADELKKVMDLNSESIKFGEINYKYASSIK
jgi:hypothetical protein